MAQAIDGIVGRNCAAADRIEKFTDGVGVHGRRSELALSRAQSRLASMGASKLSGVGAAGCGAKFGNHYGADLVGESGLIQMNKE